MMSKWAAAMQFDRFLQNPIDFHLQRPSGRADITTPEHCILSSSLPLLRPGTDGQLKPAYGEVRSQTTKSHTKTFH